MKIHKVDIDGKSGDKRAKLTDKDGVTGLLKCRFFLFKKFLGYTLHFYGFAYFSISETWKSMRKALGAGFVRNFQNCSSPIE